MIFDCLPGEYKLFIAGMRTDMSITELHSILRPFGVINNITIKSRHKNYWMNLGYGVLSTDCLDTYTALLERQNIHLKDCKIQIRDYRVNSCLKLFFGEVENFILLSGFRPNQSYQQISFEINKKWNKSDVSSVCDQDYTPESLNDKTKVVKVKFKFEKAMKDFKSQFPA